MGARFDASAREAIYNVDPGRCVGCGSTNLSAQHRRARGMGGSRDDALGTPSGGVALCGGRMAGTVGCHGWAERHPAAAALLGWRRGPGDAGDAPFYTRFGWKAWGVEDGWWHTVYVDPVEDLDRRADRDAAVGEYEAALRTGQAGS